MSKISWPYALLAALLCAAAWPARATDVAAFDAAFQQFQRAAAGDKGAIEPAAQAGESASPPGCRS